MNPIVRNLAALVILPAGLSAQTLEQRILAVASGTVHLSYAARPGVCGDGRDNIRTREVNEEWEADCEDQPVRVRRLSEERRRTAVFWLGQAAGAAAGQALDSIAGDEQGDRGVRKQAVFALSQRSADEGVPALIRIARSNRDPELRKTALFWLGQSDDPRALDLFEEILR
jgi:HEAT repeat protein